MALEALMRARETAQVLGIPLSRLYELSRNGLTPCVRIGRSFRYSPTAISAFIATGGASLPGVGRRDVRASAHNR